MRLASGVRFPCRTRGAEHAADDRRARRAECQRGRRDTELQLQAAKDKASINKIIKHLEKDKDFVSSEIKHIFAQQE